MKSVLKWIVWPLILVTLFPKGTFSQHPVTVLVNQRATLNASSCENGKWIKVIPTQATIAKCQNHKCEIEKPFQKKNEFVDMSNNLVFKSTKYNDWGTYEFICNGEIHSYKLDVLVPHNKTARPLSNITLMCYVTNAKDVTWRHKDKMVLYHTDNGSTRIGKGFESRVSLNEDCFEDGNCSLTLTAVRGTDAGLYRCFYDDESEKGDPHAYMVFVNAEHSSPEENCTDYNVCCIISGFLAGVFCIVCGGLAVSLFKVHQSTSTTASQTQNEPCENEHMLSFDITESVQESDSNHKSSSTVPFVN